MRNASSAAGPVALDARAQVAGGEVLHDDVGVALGEAVLEHLGDVRAVDARGREIFLHEARQQVRIAAAFGLEDLEHHLLFVGAALAQADIRGGAAAQRLHGREALDAGRPEHGLGVGQALRLGAQRSCSGCRARPRASSSTCCRAARIGLISAADGRDSDLRGGGMGGALTSISAGGLWRVRFGRARARSSGSWACRAAPTATAGLPCAGIRRR